MPNVVAGLLIGIANPSWISVVGSSAVWGVVWIVWSIIRKSPWIQASVQKGMMRMEWGLTRSWITALSIEYVTSVLTVLPIGCVVYLIKVWVT